ncbi:excalibur calcium-binding domain-containing protein [Streptomyces edwardsiae]|uniref:LAETG motif-containing sortase-dependent surface protein n=1 Tax=Streptomyces edwardsiae TaxID=3075527 RepID=A0ABU2QI67_9ACTN|nr:LAETG motif-containing sortase-dependent surface protein [Streptomyces sp. DSM 41635]MDT0402899.1 LAETG motif-containing sortase-dependent surface protein [Streptomyces sp. DSM 41635]
MHPFRTSAATLLAALALAAVPATAVAHGGNHPFKNCTEAYDNGYSNIARGDDHYGKHLDRDNDGIGCDQPPADFKPHEESTETGTTGSDGKEQSGGTDLAETGGSNATPYIAAGGAAVVLLGGGVMIAARRRRGGTD